MFVERNSYLTLAGGTGIADGVQTPDVRGVIGFVFEPSIGDRDGDGYKDDVDQCPDEPEDFDGVADEDGCPDPDDDRDGILDVDDACPNEPERYNGYEDEDGCDDRGLLEVETGGFVLFEKIRFETDSARILPENYPLLDAIAAALQGHPEITLLEIQGHADERASDEYNIWLTRDRAAAVIRGLLERRVRPERMRSAGYGERCPIDPRHEPEAWATNRRVEIKILRTTEGPTNAELVCPAGRDLVPR